MKQEISENLVQLIETKAWQQLSVSEKREVLESMTQDEFEELHEMALQLVNHSKAKHRKQVDDELKNRIFAVQQKPSSLHPTLKIAASFLVGVMLSALLFMPWRSSNRNIAQKSDTVYISKNVRVPELIHDTVIKRETKIVRVIENRQPIAAVVSTETKSKEETGSVSRPLVRVLDSNELKSKLESLAGKSMQEDSLYTKLLPRQI